jgi:hypothetical protein
MHPYRVACRVVVVRCCYINVPVDRWGEEKMLSKKPAFTLNARLIDLVYLD